MTPAKLILLAAAARGADATVQGTGTGTDADPCATTNCNTAGTECTYTATVDPFAGPTGYFKFAECGDVANPVIVMKRGVTYTFDQSDNSNWYHPLGFAYYVDGAHNEVDELEPGIAPAKGVCYNANGMHGTTCENSAASCGGTWLGVGYVHSDGCCICEAGCDHSKETGTSCTYYDTRTIPETCKYTATFDPHAGPVGYFKFDECGDIANPVIKMKQGTTYIFDQSHDSNWYHPLGWAYFVDGAHNEVDELEPGIAPPDNGACYGSDHSVTCNTAAADCAGSWFAPGYVYSGCCMCENGCDHSKETGTSCTYYDSPAGVNPCAADNTCQAPMYYKNGEFAGTTYDNTAATPVGGDDFGLDVYEPEFFYPKDQWSENLYFVALTVTDTTYAKDLFYFCHIHAGMSGVIKVLDSSGANPSTAHATSVFDPSTYYKTPSTYDQSCGTYGLDAYKSGATCTDEFLCHTGTLAEGSFGDCLKAMDCAMDKNMMTNLDTTSDVASFMHQMIPHHENAINMAKLLLKQNALTITRRKLREEGRRLARARHHTDDRRRLRRRKHVPGAEILQGRQFRRRHVPDGRQRRRLRPRQLRTGVLHPEGRLARDQVQGRAHDHGHGLRDGHVLLLPHPRGHERHHQDR